MIQWQQFVSGSTLMVLSQVVTAVSHWTEENFKVTWRDMWPSMVTHTRNLCSAFNPSKVHTQTVNTHTPWTHTRSSGQPFMLRCPGSSWGFSLLKGLTSVVVLKVERALDIHSPHLQFLPDPRLEPATSGYKSDALSIRPQLPLKVTKETSAFSF